MAAQSRHGPIRKETGMSGNENLRRIIRGTAALAAFGLIALIALLFLPTLPSISHQDKPASDLSGAGGKGLGTESAGVSNQQIKQGQNREKNNARAMPLEPPPAGIQASLAGPVAPTDDPMLEIRAPSPHYWRMASYDTFDGTSWSNSLGDSAQIGCNESMQTTTSVPNPLDISVKILVPGDVQAKLVAPLIPVKICTGAAVSFDTSSLSAQAAEPLPVNSTYQVESSITSFSPDTLRAAPKDFPSNISGRYLQLPPTTPDRIQQLALSITKGATNEYDKVEQIKTYLQSNYSYTYTPPATPPGRNGVDYFLFDIK